MYTSVSCRPSVPGDTCLSLVQIPGVMSHVVIKLTTVIGDGEESPVIVRVLRNVNAGLLT